MDVRKLIKSGPSSLLVSLPNQWLHQNNLEKGDSVFLDVQPDKLIISSQREQKPTPSKEIRIAPKTTALLKEKIIRAILHNIDTIYVDRKKHDLSLKEVVSILDNYSGITYSLFPDTIHIQNTLNKEKVKPLEEFKEVTQINSSMLKKIISSKGAQIQDIILLINNLKRKSLLIEATINYKLLNEMSMSKEELVSSVGLKIVLQQIPIILDKEKHIIQQTSILGSSDNCFRDFVKNISSLSTKLFSTTSEQKESLNITIKENIMHVQNLSAKEKDPLKINFLRNIEAVYQAGLKILHAFEFMS